MSKIVIFNKENPNGVERDMTPEEQSLYDADVAKEADETVIGSKAHWVKKEADNETLKASAKAKLIAGEALTEEEADTIVL
jgi:hypothetical protein